VAASGKDREERAARERARLYTARHDFHAALGRRSLRDNLVAGIVGGVIVLAAIGGQVAYVTIGPGTPEPTPASTPAPTDGATPAPDDSLAPTTPASDEPAPDASVTP
jgi:hypothetical protein